MAGSKNLMKQSEFIYSPKNISTSRPFNTGNIVKKDFTQVPFLKFRKSAKVNESMTDFSHNNSVMLKSANL